MKKRLCIGIQYLDEEWRAVLNQIGVWFEETDYSKDLLPNYSTLILNKTPNPRQKNLLNNYLKDGGSVLEMAGVESFFSKNKIDTYNAKTVINNTDHEAFLYIPFIDIFSLIKVHPDSWLFEGLIHFVPDEGGRLAFFGTPIQQLMQEMAYTRKRFYSQHGRFPDELVSKISKHELMEVFTATLKELHIQQSLPFLQKWTSPKESPVFCFRIDSDFGDLKSIKKLYSTLKKHHISATWFLHVKAHEDWLNTFHDFEEQEIALHGYKHGTTSSSSKATVNIRKGKKLLEQAGFNPAGYCAPYGIKNNALEKSLLQFDFEYTSEFSFGYDGFPLQSKGKNQPLQLPIHPICTGSLKRQKYSERKMKNYFKFVLQNKLARFEPVIFYHHPLQPGLKVIDHLFQMVNIQELPNLTFLEYAEFWKARQASTFTAWVEDGGLSIKDISHPQQYLQVSNSHQSFRLVKDSQNNHGYTKTSEFEYSNSYLPEPDDIQKMRSRDLSLIKTSLLDWKHRIRL